MYRSKEICSYLVPNYVTPSKRQQLEVVTLSDDDIIRDDVLDNDTDHHDVIDDDDVDHTTDDQSMCPSVPQMTVGRLTRVGFMKQKPILF